MLILIFIISVIATVLLARISIYEDNKSYDDGELFFTGAVGTGVVAALVLMAGVLNISIIINARYADSRIRVVEEKNESLEAGIQVAVERYLKHEGDTYSEMSPDEAIAVVSTYPELASNELVKEQIATYKSNREEILRYEQSKIDGEVAKWWLYFGGEK